MSETSDSLLDNKIIIVYVFLSILIAKREPRGVEFSLTREANEFNRSSYLSVPSNASSTACYTLAF